MKYLATFRCASRLLVLAVLLTLSVSRTFAANNYTLENGVITLANSAYEVTLNADNGGITAIVDKATGEVISTGTIGGNLWSVQFDNNKVVNSRDYTGKFASAWDDSTGTLTLSYTDAITVVVTITADETAALRLAANVTNNSGSIISDFALPVGLQVAESAVQDGLLPMMPGAQISAEFFTGGRTFINEYPGVLFADYLALRSSSGRLTVYAEKVGALQPVLLGYEHIKDVADTTALRHTYQTWIADGQSWLSPRVTVNVGEDYPQTIAAYRADSGLAAFKSITEKLGDAAPTYFASPMYKLDLTVLKKTFSELKDAVINNMNFSGMVHFVAFQLGGHDKNYPSFIPAAPKWGTNDDFADLVSLIHAENSLAVPYTNFSWWNSDGPVMFKLPQGINLPDIITITDSHGVPGFETHNSRGGFVVNLHNAFVQETIAEQHNALLQTIGADAIFEDQFGARSNIYDYNPAGLDQFDPSTSYFEGVLDHYRAQVGSNLFTEIGVDALAENGVGFMGTNYLWDMLGYRGDTADVTSYYPMAGMLLRDKVLLYQHNLAAETWTNNKDMLRWNLTQGYNLSNAFLDAKTGGLNMDNPWLNVVGAFQKYALANYAAELVTAYEPLPDNVTKTSFPTYTVYSNWDAEKPFTTGGSTLPAGGVVTRANDGSVTAGVFTSYNDAPLSEGDHYLVEVRAADSIRILQPLGADTPLSVGSNGWSAVTVTAYAYDGTMLGTTPTTVDGDRITFTYASTLDGQPVGYYDITAG